jgi:hypothetical protein
VRPPPTSRAPVPSRWSRRYGRRTPRSRWRQRPNRERGQCLRRIADVIRAQADELAALETLERAGYGTCPLRGVESGPSRTEGQLVRADVRGSQNFV